MGRLLANGGFFSSLPFFLKREKKETPRLNKIGPKNHEKAQSWARSLLEHGLLGDGAGVRSSPDEVLDVRERPPVPHLCTNHEIRTTDDEWRRRRLKQLNHPRMGQLGPPPPTSDAGHGLPRHGPPILIRRLPRRLHPRRRSGSDSRSPWRNQPGFVRRTRRRRRRRRRIGRPPLSLLRSSRRSGGLCLWTQEPRGDAEHTNAAGPRRR